MPLMARNGLERRGRGKRKALRGGISQQGPDYYSFFVPPQPKLKSTFSKNWFCKNNFLPLPIPRENAEGKKALLFSFSSPQKEKKKKKNPLLLYFFPPPRHRHHLFNAERKRGRRGRNPLFSRV